MRLTEYDVCATLTQTTIRYSQGTTVSAKERPCHNRRVGKEVQHLSENVKREPDGYEYQYKTDERAISRLTTTPLALEAFS
jgi:hypothetical protein